MKLSLDPDVGSVISFMQSNIPANKLVPVAKQLTDIAAVMWGRYPIEGIAPPTLASSDLVESSAKAATQ